MLMYSARGTYDTAATKIGVAMLHLRVILGYLTLGSIGRSNPEVMGSNPTGAKFSLARGDSQISFNRG